MVLDKTEDVICEMLQCLLVATPCNDRTSMLPNRDHQVESKWKRATARCNYGSSRSKDARVAFKDDVRHTLHAIVFRNYQEDARRIGHRYTRILESEQQVIVSHSAEVVSR